MHGVPVERSSLGVSPPPKTASDTNTKTVPPAVTNRHIDNKLHEVLIFSDAPVSSLSLILSEDNDGYGPSGEGVHVGGVEYATRIVKSFVSPVPKSGCGMVGRTLEVSSDNVSSDGLNVFVIRPND